MYSDFLMTSAYANKIEVVEQDKDIPEGCAIVTGMDQFNINAFKSYRVLHIFSPTLKLTCGLTV